MPQKATSGKHGPLVFSVIVNFSLFRSTGSIWGQWRLDSTGIVPDRSGSFQYPA